jgi:hypothetical protein
VARGIVVGWGTVLQAGNWISSIYLNLPAALGLGVYSATNRNEYQKQGEKKGGRARPACKADNLTAICEPIIYTMWDPQHLTALQASKMCYGDSFSFCLYVRGSSVNINSTS